MIFDLQSMLANAQAVVASAASENVIDLGPVASGYNRKVGLGSKVPLAIQVVEDFDNLTSLEIKVQTSATSDFSSSTDIATTGAIPLADLVAGYRSNLDVIPRNQEQQYMRLYFVVTGTAPTAGKITSGIVAGDNSYG